MRYIKWWFFEELKSSRKAMNKGGKETRSLRHVDNLKITSGFWGEGGLLFQVLHKVI